MSNIFRNSTQYTHATYKTKQYVKLSKYQYKPILYISYMFIIIHSYYQTMLILLLRCHTFIDKRYEAMLPDCVRTIQAYS